MQGSWLVSILDWSERMGEDPITAAALEKLGVPTEVMRQIEHAVYMCIENHTAGHAKDAVQHGVHNGIDVRRELFRDQLLFAGDKKNVIMTEFMRLKEPTNATCLRKLTFEIQRLTDTMERLSNKPFDGEATIGKFWELIPAGAWCQIAPSARIAKP